MSSSVSATGTANPHSHVTPFDQVLACEKQEEARVKEVEYELNQTEKEAEQAMRDSEETQEKKLREDARQALRAERDAIGKEMELQETSMQRELEQLDAQAKDLTPSIVTAQVETVLSPDFLSLAA